MRKTTKIEKTKKFRAKKQTNLVIFLGAMLTLSACGSAADTAETAAANAAAKAATAAQASSSSAAAATASASLSGLKAADLVSLGDENYAADWDESDAVTIKLAGASASVDGAGAEAANGSVTITAAGTYVLSGSLSDGQIVVDTADAESVHIVLNGADLTDGDGAPIYVKAAEKVILTLAEGTVNSVTDGVTYTLNEDEEPSAAIFSKADLTVNGTGSLTVTANYKDGIASKDALNIVSGTIDIKAADDGIVGKDRVYVEDGTVTIDAAGDGIKSTNDKDAEKGFVAIKGGTFEIKAGNDGIQGETNVVVDGGDFNIATGGGHANGPEHTEAMGGGFGGGGNFGGQRPSGGMRGPGGTGDPGTGQGPAVDGSGAASGTATSTDGTTDGPPALPDGERPTDGGTPPAMPDRVSTGSDSNAAADADSAASSKAAADASTGESDSMKGIKAGTVLTINGGTFAIDSADDALHSNGSTEVTGGDLQISTGDDALHGETALTITDGTIDVKTSYEGLEAENITIDGGDIRVAASDDGVNASEASTASADTAASDENADTTVGAASASVSSAKAVTASASADTSASVTTASAASTAANGDTSTDTARGMGGGGFGGGMGAGSARLTINGGTLVVNAEGDGLDANGSIAMTGGTVTVYGPTNDGNGSLDYDGTFVISGGTLLAAGSAGMAQAPSDTSSQLSVAMTFADTQAAGTQVDVKDAEGRTVATVAPSKEFRAVIVSSAELKDGGTYTVSAGGSDVVTFTISGSVTTWVNESGVTTGNTGGMGGGRR
ncbi:carbohydrate-binding domain-containing protein [Saccharibacillus alkalitolerans]|uniref:Carbohydrate-binding domain-containing protein n=1 Tax=Saccharibacillus alkalitolerans TaxID=2705290 RepID=A0ABX0FB22_9BACL|nr:carbohydrate-binding domain-containing protein [Saccharibacillus alkalitolerans]NGZ76436.1 carbohydrate-binding domain-containing protein [Saccharibacillus alkalitolerans]